MMNEASFVRPMAGGAGIALPCLARARYHSSVAAFLAVRQFLATEEASLMYATFPRAPDLGRGSLLATLLRWLVPLGIVLATALVAAA